ncbi:hypothetical protein [Maribacter stanieri]|uniref:hypothetical protein n=1 Tax=Maribacter stanieri TaxID=440514 RepID=UPI0030DDDE5B|tara:strand:+ start:474 stop:827 length:354 start_codon:yes stop_codon:yes gene_type:complete
MSNPIQENWVILNYDFGLKGDYETLYAFLDNQNAIDCGNSAAAFDFTFMGKDLSYQDKIDQIKNKIEDKVSLKKGDRIYIIVHNEKGQPRGTFIFGHRKTAAWEGYGNKSNDDSLPF